MAQGKIISHLRRNARRRIERLSDKTMDKVTFRRCQIVLRAANGEKAAAIATALACSPSTVSRTLTAYERQGDVTLRRGKSPGRPPKIKSEDKQLLDKLVSREPRALGKNFSNWSAKKLRQHLKLAVHITTVLRHLWRLGWRWRRPVKRVASPDPRYQAKKRYVRRLECRARRGEIHLYYADEIDLDLLPTLSGRWMRIGQQTQVNTPGQNQKHYGFGAVNIVDGRLSWVAASHKNNVAFRDLLKAILDAHYNDFTPIVVVLDNYRIHKAKAVTAMLATLRRRLRLYFLPTYSPQLNPIERLWHYFRQNVTDNFYFVTMKRLLRAAEKFLAELAQTPAVVLSVIGRA